MKQASTTIAGLRTIVVDQPAARLVVVVLHGYAMVPEALAPFARSLGVAARFYLPEGPLDAHPEGRCWWHLDIEARTRVLATGPRDLAAEHPEGADEARHRLVAFLDAVRLACGVMPLALVGFSQGGMLACDTLLRDDPPIAALALLSSSRISADEWEPISHPLLNLPVLVSHGREDADLAFSAGEALRDFVADAGADVTWVPFDGGHEIPLLVWRAVRKFLLQVQRASAS